MASTELQQRWTSSISLVLQVIALAAVSTAAHGLTITPGHLYSTSSPTNDAIQEYDANGQWLASLAIPGGDLRGIMIGPDGLFYVVVNPGQFGAMPHVDVIDAAGHVIRSYPFTGSVWRYVALGKIAFSRDFSTFFVASEEGVYKFSVNGGSGIPITTELSFDVDVLPTGQLLTAEEGAIALRSASGALISRITSISDPTGISGGPVFLLGPVDAVTYSQDDDVTYVAMLASAGQPSLFALAGLSNVMVRFENFSYGMDIALVEHDRILVGSRGSAPGMFTRTMDYLGQVSGMEAPFVTAYRDRLFAHGFD
ncbi:MAG: hypothetical protein WAV67_12565 [Dokdonella sp.]